MLQCVRSVAKMTLLFFAKMVVFPIILGWTVHVAAGDILGRSFENMVASTSAYPILTISMHWVVGIAYMLVVTITVLQLKDVLHPAVLRGIVRVSAMSCLKWGDDDNIPCAITLCAFPNGGRLSLVYYGLLWFIIWFIIPCYLVSY